MKTNIIIKKVWEDEISAEINVRFETLFNFEKFVVSGNYECTKQEMMQLAEQLKKTPGKIIFGDKKSENYCELTISQSERGYKNINYHLVKVGKSGGYDDAVDISLNSGAIIEPAVMDRILSRLSEFYYEPEGTQISLMYEE